MQAKIRQEQLTDFEATETVVQKAFEKVAYSDQKEHLLVRRLRKSDAFVPELSLVAEVENHIVGHVLLTKVRIKNENESFTSLALAPVSVHPNFQNRGIGQQLVEAAHRKARSMGFSNIVLIGHVDYYPRFGYKRADHFDIAFPFKIPKENGMVIELVKNALHSVNGIVEYPKEFYE